LLQHPLVLLITQPYPRAPAAAVYFAQPSRPDRRHPLPRRRRRRPHLHRQEERPHHLLSSSPHHKPGQGGPPWPSRSGDASRSPQGRPWRDRAEQVLSLSWIAASRVRRAHLGCLGCKVSLVYCNQDECASIWN
uniref:Uncharacterized protein n=1 Tax=Triticum urartu TaxID=4572 RepID=A0A8R7V286_TRIUA